MREVQPPTQSAPTQGRFAAGANRARASRWIFLVPVAVIALVVFAFALQRAAPSTTGPAAATATLAPRPQARGQVQPVARARVGTLTGGVVASVAVEVGDAVGEQQELARVRGTAGAEVLTAPIRGTVTGILVHVGDTVLPGTVIATVGDLSRLQVETTDVDEFLIPHVRPGQNVTLTVDAVGQQLAGRVRTVALEPVTTAAGDEHYPVAIDLLDGGPNLRAGMTVRVLFPD